MIYINHSFHNGFFHRVFDGSTAPRMRAQYPHLSHEYDHGVPRELPWGHYTVFGSSPGLPGKPTKAPQDMFIFTVTKAFFNILINHYSSDLCIAFSIETSCRGLLPARYCGSDSSRASEYFASQCQSLGD